MKHGIFLKISSLALSIAMALGVGVVAANMDIEPVKAEDTTITFNLGANGTATHSDGSEKSSYTETVDGYTLTLTGGSKMYTGAIDATGNGCIKLGTSKATGGFSFTVPENITSAVIHAGKYKANTTKMTVNGTDYTLESSSDDGAYDEITVDTTSTKTVTLTTVTGGVRAMINTIEYVIDGGTSSTPTYTVTYDKNGGTGTGPADQSGEAGATITVADCTFSKENYTFTTWNTAADGSGTPYLADSTLTIGEEDITLYAQWAENPKYTVTYNVNGGTGTVESQRDYVNTEIKLNDGSSISKDGHYFSGWNTSIDGTGTPYDGGSIYTITADIILYAQWIEGSAPSVSTSYNEVELNDLVKNDYGLLVATTSNGSHYALANNNGTSAAPAAVKVTVTDGVISTTDVYETLLWTVDRDNNNLTFYKGNTTENWLYCTAANNGVRVGTNTNKTFVVDSSGYLQHVGTGRYLGVYNSQDWRCYTNTTGNTANQTFAFYKYTETIGGQDPVLQGIELLIDETKFVTDYVEGQSWSLDGITVNALYDIGDPDDVTDEATIKFWPEKPSIGKTSVEITATYKEKSTPEPVTINGIVVSEFTGYTLVTDVNDIHIGDSIIIGQEGTNVLMTTDAGNYRNRHESSNVVPDVGVTDSETTAAVLTVVSGTVAGTYALAEVTTDSIGYLSFVSRENYLKTVSEKTAASDIVFSIDGEKHLHATSNSVTNKDDKPYEIRYNKNPGQERFSGYAGTMDAISIYKINTSTSKDAVTTFANNHLRMNDETFNGDGTGECFDLYEGTKAAYLNLNVIEKDIFLNCSDFDAAQARLSEWARINNDALEEDGSISSARNNFLGISNNETSVMLIVVMSSISLLSFSCFLFLRKRKEQ